LLSSLREQGVSQCIVGRSAQASETEKALVRALLIISVIFAVTSLTARAGVTYTITSYPGGLADLPCGATSLDDAGLCRVFETIAGRNKGTPRDKGCELCPRAVSILFEALTPPPASVAIIARAAKGNGSRHVAESTRRSCGVICG
jgi:hypothetical protein